MLGEGERSGAANGQGPGASRSPGQGGAGPAQGAAPGLVGFGPRAATTSPPGGGDALVKDATDATFMADVIEASRAGPVIVDFWAPWCGPCKQLGPALEKAVKGAKGAVRMVKVNIDENPRIASQLRVQSIPTVYAFDNGQPIDGFQGALPESQVKAFVERLSGPLGPSDLETLLAEARESLNAGDAAGAMQAYAAALQMEPENPKAIAGLARCYLAGGDAERAGEVVAMAPANAKDPDLDSVRATLALAARSGASDADAKPFEDRLASDPYDHAARFELAKLLSAKGRFDAAADHLLTLMAKDRGWNDDAARKELLTVFEAAGPTSEVARTGRRRLSSILFA